MSADWPPHGPLITVTIITHIIRPLEPPACLLALLPTKHNFQFKALICFIQTVHAGQKSCKEPQKLSEWLLRTQHCDFWTHPKRMKFSGIQTKQELLLSLSHS